MNVQKDVTRLLRMIEDVSDDLDYELRKRNQLIQYYIEALSEDVIDIVAHWEEVDFDAVEDVRQFGPREAERVRARPYQDRLELLRPDGLPILVDSSSSALEEFKTSPSPGQTSQVVSSLETGALARYDQLIRDEPRSAEHHIGRARVNGFLGRWSAAMDDIEAAFRLNPNATGFTKVRDTVLGLMPSAERFKLGGEALAQATDAIARGDTETARAKYERASWLGHNVAYIATGLAMADCLDDDPSHARQVIRESSVYFKGDFVPINAELVDLIARRLNNDPDVTPERVASLLHERAWSFDQGPMVWFEGGLRARGLFERVDDLFQAMKTHA